MLTTQRCLEQSGHLWRRSQLSAGVGEVCVEARTADNNSVLAPVALASYRRRANYGADLRENGRKRQTRLYRSTLPPSQAKLLHTPLFTCEFTKVTPYLRCSLRWMKAEKTSAASQAPVPLVTTANYREISRRAEVCLAPPGGSAPPPAGFSSWRHIHGSPKTPPFEVLHPKSSLSKSR